MNNKLTEIIKNGKNLPTEKTIIKDALAKFKVELLDYLTKKVNQKDLCKIKFGDGYSLFKVFEALEKINKRAIFQITPKHVNAYTTNDSKTYLMKIILQVNNPNFSFFYSSELSINITDLVKSLKCNKSENISTTLKFKENQLEVVLFSKIHKSKISRIIKDVQNDFEKETILEELSKLNYAGYFVMDNNKFLHILSQSGRFSEVIKLNLTNICVIISESNIEGNSEIRWEKNLLHKLKVKSTNFKKNGINAYISIENLKNFTPFLFEDNQLIKFYIKEEIPIKIRVNFKSLEDSYGLLFIAQRDKSAYN